MMLKLICYNVALILPLLSVQYTYSLSKDNAKNDLSYLVQSTYKNTFDKSNIFDKPLELNKWYDAVNQIREFVTKKSKENNEIINSLNDLVKLNNNLLNDIKIIYNLEFRSEKKPNSQDIKKVNTDLSEISLSIPVFEQEIENIKIKKGIFFTSSQQEAKSILGIFLYCLNKISKKQSEDYSKKIQKKRKFK